MMGEYDVLQHGLFDDGHYAYVVIGVSDYAVHGRKYFSIVDRPTTFEVARAKADKWNSEGRE